MDTSTLEDPGISLMLFKYMYFIIFIVFVVVTTQTLKVVWVLFSPSWCHAWMVGGRALGKILFGLYLRNNKV